MIDEIGVRSPVVPPMPLGGRYWLGDVMGYGGTAVVHRGIDQRTAATVAVKLSRGGVHDGDILDRFQAEAQAMAVLDHPCVVRLHDAGMENGRAYLVMDLVDGAALAARVTSGPLPVADIARIARDMAAALAHVHGHGLVHRDVKPGNILLDTNGGAHLADFGIAMLNNATRPAETGIVVGTAAYLAPEQVRAATVRPAADIYALGLTLLECHTGSRAYPGAPVEAALARLARPPWIPASIPSCWRTLLTAMTATDPTNRPAACDIARHLVGPQRGRMWGGARGMFRRSQPRPTTSRNEVTAIDGVASQRRAG